MSKVYEMYPRYPVVQVTCLGCEKKLWSNEPELIVDLAGPAFKAYYCNLACFRQAKGDEKK
jgi:hypothetical protein